MWQWIVTSQRDLLQKMRHAVVTIRGGEAWTGSSILVALAFAYGIVHALGPGHGKAVITSYALANSDTIRRSIAISFMAALVQAGSAILLVLVGLLTLGYTARNILALEARLEIASGVLIALIGVYLIYRRVRYIMSSRHARHHQKGATVDNCTCDHAHFVEPRSLSGPWSWRAATGMALSIGVRPCTGALLLLVFALSQGMLWAGLLGTVAMALGTAVTVSALAMAAVGSRDLALRAMSPASGRAAALGNAVVLLAGLTLIALGAAMALTPPPRSAF